MMGWQWHQLDHIQIICISLQTDNHASNSQLSFYRPDALPAAKPTASKHLRKILPPLSKQNCWDEGMFHYRLFLSANQQRRSTEGTQSTDTSQETSLTGLIPSSSTTRLSNTPKLIKLGAKDVLPNTNCTPL